ncbi:uncharacterized protein LOC144635937 isoform X2 [Oculina patagonica]
MRFSSSNVLSEADSSICTDKDSSHTDMERMENPFQNLHPKIYYRQKNAASRKVILDNKRELTMDIKSSPLMSVNLKTDHLTKHSNSSWPIKTDDYSVISQKTVTRKEHNDFVKGRETYLRNPPDTVAYLNERNIYLSRDVSEGEKLALPLLALPRAAKDSAQLINTSCAPSSRSNKGLFPPIKDVPTFIPLVHEKEKRRRKRWRKKFRDTETARLGEQGGEYWWNVCTTTYPTLPSARGNLANHTIQRKCLQEHQVILESDTKKKGCGSQGVSKATDFSSTNADDFYSRNPLTSQTLSARTYSDHDDAKGGGMGRDYMILKAKIHRSSFI